MENVLEAKAATNDTFFLKVKWPRLVEISRKCVLASTERKLMKWLTNSFVGVVVVSAQEPPNEKARRQTSNGNNGTDLIGGIDMANPLRTTKHL
jgi:hypothetical protein